MIIPEFNIFHACGELKINKDVYLRIVFKAFEQTTSDIAQLRQAHQANDVATVQALAHRLKGDYANLRMAALSAVADELNRHAKEAYESAHALELIEKFYALFKEMKTEIEGTV